MINVEKRIQNICLAKKENVDDVRPGFSCALVFVMLSSPYLLQDCKGKQAESYTFLIPYAHKERGNHTPVYSFKESAKTSHGKAITECVWNIKMYFLQIREAADHIMFLQMPPSFTGV